MAAACRADLVRVCVKNRLIVRLVVLCEDLVKLRADLVAVVLKSLLRHTDTAVRHKCLLQRFVCLETDHLFEVFDRGVDIARTIRRQTRDDLRLHIEHAALAAFFLLEFLHARPQAVRRIRRRCEETLVAIVRRIVALDEVADVDLLLPDAPLKTVPALALQHILPPILLWKAKPHSMLS